jgi:teichuronic acid biosynthesis glycosyltransferase TuaC
MKVLFIVPGLEEGSSFIFSKREYRVLNSMLPGQIEIYYLNTSLSPWNLIRVFFELKRKIKTANISVIHSQYGTITGFVSLLVSFQRKLVITFRGSDINGSRDVSFFRRVTSVFLSWLTLPFADHVIFVSDSLRKNSLNAYKECSIIGTGVDTSSFYPLNKFKARAQIGLDDSKIFALFYSSFNSPNKRKDLAVAAIALLNSKGINIELLEIEGNILPEQMPFYLNASDLVLMLSNYEGSPTIVQEAIACGVPVVSVDVGDTKEKLLNINNSVIVERNTIDIANGILKVLKIGFIQPKETDLFKISLQNSVNRIIEVYSHL